MAMFPIGPTASKQRLPCPWKSWILISGMKDIGDYTKECEDPRKFGDIHYASFRRVGSWKFILNPPSISRSSRHGTGKSIQETYSTGKCNCSLVVAVFIHGRVLTIRIMYMLFFFRSEIPFSFRKSYRGNGKSWRLYIVSSWIIK